MELLSHILSLNIDGQKFSWMVVATYIPVKNMNVAAAPYLCQHLISPVCLAVTLVIGSGISCFWFVFSRWYCLIFYNPVRHFNLWCAFCPDLHWVVCTLILIEYIGIYIMNISSSGVHVLLISSLWLAFSLSTMFLIKWNFKLYWSPIYPPFIFMVTAFHVLFKISLPIRRFWDLPVFSSRNFTVLLSYLSLSISKIIIFSYRYLTASLKRRSFHFQTAVVPLWWTRWPYKCGYTWNSLVSSIGLFVSPCTNTTAKNWY